jgi:DNA topoisomerase-1
VKDELEAELRDDLPRLRPEEAAVLALLDKRLAHEISRSRSDHP